MSDSILRSIKLNVQSTLEAVAWMEKVYIEEINIPKKMISYMPFANTFFTDAIRVTTPTGSGNTRVGSAIGSETFSMSLTVEIWAQVTSAERDGYLADIHEEMYKDPTRGGFAETTTISGWNSFDIDVTNKVRGLLINFDIIYRNTWGNPYTY